MRWATYGYNAPPPPTSQRNKVFLSPGMYNTRNRMLALKI